MPQKGKYIQSNSSARVQLLVLILATIGLSCGKMKSTEEGNGRVPVARVENSYLFQDELEGIVGPNAPTADSVARIEAYIHSWIRKELLIQEATRKMDINEAEVERKILDYRYSIIAYEYQNQMVKKNLDTTVSKQEIQEYYKGNVDNFILKQNIVQATFIKVPKTAPPHR